MPEPRQKPWKSEQSVQTPPEFIKAVKKRLGIDEFDIDLAADESNSVAEEFYTEKMDGLSRCWKFGYGWSWCNPPYSNLTDWTMKARDESHKGANVAMLVPASTGSNWWASYVNGHAYVTYLNGRLTFVGHDSPYPKDLALLLYAPFLAGGSCVWRWKD